MAKKTKGKGKGKAVVPKRVGGIKVPKKLRQSGESFAALLTTPAARQIAADVLIAAAGALVASKGPRRAVANLAGNVADAGSAVAETGAKAAATTAGAAQSASAAVADVVTEAARRILPASLGGDEARQGGSEPPGKRRKHRERPSSH